MTDLARRAFAAAVVALALHPADALAYIDPGSGSLILQLLFGGFVGAAAVIKLYWRRIRDRLGGTRSVPAADADRDPPR